MAQKVQIYKNTNEESKIYGKYLVRPVYDNRFVETKQLADFIQTQCTVKHSDIVAVLRELGEAFKHFFELGQKVKLDGIGIFKVGISSATADTEAAASAALVKKSRVLFQPETTAVLKGVTEVTRPMKINGVATLVPTTMQVFNHPATMLKDIRFELTKDLQGSGIAGGSDDTGGGDDTGGDDETRP